MKIHHKCAFSVYMLRAKVNRNPPAGNCILWGILSFPDSGSQDTGSRIDPAFFLLLGWTPQYRAPRSTSLWAQGRSVALNDPGICTVVNREGKDDSNWRLRSCAKINWSSNKQAPITWVFHFTVYKAASLLHLSESSGSPTQWSGKGGRL